MGRARRGERELGCDDLESEKSRIREALPGSMQAIHVTPGSVTCCGKVARFSAIEPAMRTGRQSLRRLGCQSGVAVVADHFPVSGREVDAPEVRGGIGEFNGHLVGALLLVTDANDPAALFLAGMNIFDG